MGRQESNQRESSQQESVLRSRIGYALGLRRMDRDGVNSARVTRSRLAVAILSLPLLVGAVANTSEAGVFLWGRTLLPCPIRWVGGERACPGCGLGRSTAMVVQGKVVRASRVHPAGILVALLCVAGISIHLHILVGNKRTRRHDRWLRVGHQLFVVGVLGVWVFRFAL